MAKTHPSPPPPAGALFFHSSAAISGAKAVVAASEEPDVLYAPGGPWAQDLLRHTDSGHTDHVDLVKALKEMRQVADYINEKKREAEALNLVVRIQERLHNLVCATPPLASSSFWSLLLIIHGLYCSRSR